jgi:hypothetical protein
MEAELKTRLQELNATLRQQHPQWSQEKREWMALQALGIVKGR